MKRILACLLVAALFLGAAMAEGESEWQYNQSWGYLSEYSGSGGDVVMPPEVDGNAVRVVQCKGLNDREDIFSITVPEGVTVLGSIVIRSVRSLTSVELPQTLQVIDDFNFFECDSLAEITIPASVRLIGNCVFDWCNGLKTITFEGVCPVLKNGKSFLRDLSKDAVVYVPDDQLEAYRSALTAVDGGQIQPSGKQSLPRAELHAEFTMDPETGTLLRCDSEDSWIDVPAEIDGIPVKSIGKSAFRGNDYCYAVTLPEGLEEIGPGAFDGLSRLTYAPIPSTVRVIGEEAYAFYCGLCLTLPEGLREIPRRAFFRSALEMELTIPDGVVSIGEEAFDGSNIYALNLPASLTSIGGSAFRGYNMTEIRFEALPLPEIAEDAFKNQNREITVSLPSAAGDAEVAAAQAVLDTLEGKFTAVRPEEPNGTDPSSSGSQPAGAETPAPEATGMPGETVTEAPAGQPGPVSGGNPGAGDGRIAMDTKYACVRYIVSGHEMDASILGAELSATLHDDGSMDFIMLGKEVSGLVWRWDGGDAVADYYSAGQLRFTPAEDGTVILDFVGAMTYILAIP
ncbi:MAG: leucine-rich repeat protein [Clostridia bacterium]|nr:leucine-rich repeat protein [Clostridia bacterium]